MLVNFSPIISSSRLQRKKLTCYSLTVISIAIYVTWHCCVALDRRSWDINNSAAVHNNADDDNHNHVSHYSAADIMTGLIRVKTAISITSQQLLKWHIGQLITCTLDKPQQLQHGMTELAFSLKLYFAILSLSFLVDSFRYRKRLWEARAPTIRH